MSNMPKTIARPAFIAAPSWQGQTFQEVSSLGAFFNPPGDPQDPRHAILKRMSGIEKLMLGTDGSFTELLKDMYEEPIQPLLQSQVSERADEFAVSVLDVMPETHVWRRIVRLRTADSLRDVTFAESLIVPDRLPAVVRRGLEDGDKPIGFLLRAAKTETLRVLVDWGECPETSDARQWLHDSMVIYRTYCIINNMQPLMCVTEYFPLKDQER